MPRKTPSPQSVSRRNPRASGATDPKEPPQAYVFRLFVSGQTGRSARAIENIKRICETYFAGQYQLDVVDVYQQPELARSDKVVAVPTLLKKAPGEPKKIVGDFSNSEAFVRNLK